MSATDYHFITKWRVLADIEEVSEILSNAPDLVRWWPSVYLKVDQLAEGDETGLGKHIRLYTKGWLPYTLRWDFTVTEVRPRYGFTLEAKGDFVGRGIWTFEQDLAWVNITYDWQIRANKPLLRTLSFLFKPVFSANHHWAMAQGQKSLRLELARRRIKTEANLAQIAPPPGPTTYEPWLALAGIIALLWLCYRLIFPPKT